MARISTYALDPTINEGDKLIGTDGGAIGPDGRVIAGTSGPTKNFTIQALREYIQSRNSDVTGDYDTMLNTEDSIDSLQLFTAHAFYDPGVIITSILPTVDPDADAPIEDGSWVRITGIANTGVVLFAGSTDTAERHAGDRFMAGVASDGSEATNPEFLMIPPGIPYSFELIYIADPIRIGGTTAPVGWIIVQ